MCSESFDEEYIVWVIQRRSRRRWWPSIGLVRRTKREAIAAFKELYEDGDRQWKRQREAGEVRCIWVPLYSKSK